MQLAIQFYTQAGVGVRTVSNSHTLTTSKTEYSLSSNTPGGSYFMRTSATFTGAGSRTLMLQIDSGILAVE
jgi:hypothetical protein